MSAEIDRARSAISAIPADLPRDDWHRIGRAGIAAGLDVEALVEWSRPAQNFKSEQDVRSAFKGITADGGTGAGTLFKTAKEYGWQDSDLTTKPVRIATKPVAAKPKPKAKPRPGMSAAEVWARCEPATTDHEYVQAKGMGGAPLDGLRVVPAGDPLRIIGRLPADGALVVPAYSPTGELQSLQLVTIGDTAARLKAQGESAKRNLAGAPMTGASFTVGELVAGATVNVCESVGTAWACWQATGNAAVVCFGWGNVARVTADIRQRVPSAKIVLAPDVGKDDEAIAIARELGCAVALMPSGKDNNYDANDLARDEGHDVLAELLERAQAPAKSAPRYKLLGADELRELPPLAWRVRGVLPAVGLAALYGPSASGKSFLAFDMAAAIAEGTPWFGCRVTAAPVVYCALEGEGGFKLRAQAWEMSRGRALPNGLLMMMQPFRLTELQDVIDLAAVVPPGAVVVLDTLNRAAPTADENSSKDMGEILEATKTLQAATGGLVVLVHHTGKNAAAGLRGHSSLFAAIDAAIEVTRNGDRRDWSVAKSKDGMDGETHQFKLAVEVLGFEPTGETITSCVVERDTALADVRAVKLPQGGNQKVALDALRDLLKKAGPLNTPGAPSTCPPGRPALELEVALVRVAERLSVAPDRKTERARAAITGLIASGVVGCDKGWIWIV